MNRERGEIALVTPTQTYTLRLTVEACCALQAQTGESFDALTVAVNRGRMTALRALLWAALQATHASAVPRLEDAGPIVDAAGGARPLRVLLSEFLAINAPIEPSKSSKKIGPPVVDDRPGSLWQRMYLDARGFGITGAAYWQLSLRELWLELAASRQHAKQERERDIRLAWYCAALVWQKKLPSLESLLGVSGEPATPERQTPHEIRAAIRAITQGASTADQEGKE